MNKSKNKLLLILPQKDTITSIKYIRENAPQVKIPEIKDQPFYKSS